MAPFRRGRSAQPATESNTENQYDNNNSNNNGNKQRTQSAWERRKNRKSNNNNVSPSEENNNNRGGRRRRNENLPDDEYDPYDSDPGESYREHCMRMKGLNTKSCLTLPRFMRSNGNKETSPEVDTVATSPPSPLASEGDDFMASTPQSLPRDLTRVRYSLRTSIGDGSERQPTGPSVMERRQLRPNNIHINVSHWSDTGSRNYMEDRYAIEDMGAVQVEVSPVAVRSQNSAETGVEVTFGNRKNRRLKMPLTWLGVYDGHGGEKASQFCADWLSSYVRNEESYPFDLGYAMKNAYTAIDEDFVATGYPDGSTACSATLVGGRRIVCSNAGDSRAIVVRRDGTVVRLSRDHKPGMPDETRRISDLGGRVIYWGRWRVEGLLAVSRSIGDASLKPFVCAEPEVCEYDIGRDDWFLIISSDGVWDVMDNEEAAHVIIASSCVMEDGKLKIDTDRFKWAARNLCEHAKSCGSTDNFSVVCVDLKSCGNPAARSGRYEP